MKTSSLIHQANLSVCTEKLRLQAESGLSVRDWCAANQITKDQFYYWRRKCKDSFIQSSLPDIAPLPLPLENDCSPIATTPTTTLSCTTTTPQIQETILSSSSFKLTTSDLSLEVTSPLSPDAIIGIIKAVRNA